MPWRWRWRKAIIGQQSVGRAVEHDPGRSRVNVDLLQESLACLVQVEFCFCRIDRRKGALEFALRLGITRKMIVDDTKLAMGKVAFNEVHPVGVGTESVLLSWSACQRRLEAGNGVVPKPSRGVGGAAFIMLPPFVAPDTGDYTVLFAVFHIDLPALDRTTHHPKE